MKTQNRDSVLLLGGEIKLGLPVIRCLGLVPNMAIHYAAQENTLTRYSRFLDSYNLIVGNGDEAKLNSLLKTIKKTGSRVLLPVDEPSIEFVIRYKTQLEEHIGLPPLPDLRLLNQVIHKDKLNNWLAENNLPFAKVKELSGVDVDDESIMPSYPFLLKPIWDFGGDADGLNVHMVSHKNELKEFLTKNNFDSDNYIVQEYIPGYDIDCSLLCKDGDILAHTLQKGFILQDLQYSPGIELIHNGTFLSEIKRLIRELGWSGICHLDFRYDERDGSYKLVDFNARYWTTMLGSYVAGVNFPHLAYRTALGETYAAPDYENTHFVLTTTALKESLKLQKRQRYSLDHTGLYFAIKDPLPELAKLTSVLHS